MSAQLELLIKANHEGVSRALSEMQGQLRTLAGNAKQLNDQLKSSAAESARAMGAMRGEVESLANSFSSKLGPAGAVLGSLGPHGMAAAAGLGAAATGAALFARSLADTVGRGGRLADLSAQTGIAAESLQRLQYAAELNGNTIEQMAGAVNILQRNLANAPEKFERWGLSVERLTALRPEQQLAAISEAIRGMDSPTQQAAAAMEMLGRSGAQLLPTLKSNMAALADEADRLGAVMGDETVAAADALGDATTKLDKAWVGLKDSLTAVVIENSGATQWLEDMATAVGALTGRVREGTPALSAYFAMLAKLAGLSQMGGGLKLAGAMLGGPGGPPAAGGGGFGANLPEINFAGIDAAALRAATENVRTYASELKKLQAERIKALQSAPRGSFVESITVSGGADTIRGVPYTNPNQADLPTRILGQQFTLPAVTKATISWDQQLQRLANTMQAMGSVTGRAGQNLAALTATIANIGGNLKDMKGGGFLSKLVGGLGIASSVVGFIGGLFGGGPSKAEREAEQKKRLEDAARAAAEAQQNRISGLGSAATSLSAFLQAGGGGTTGGTYAVGIFAALTKETGNVVKAIQQLGPALDQMADKFKGSSAAFDQLLGMSNVLKTSGMGDQISALQDLAKALGQGGIAGTPAIVGALATDTTAQFHQLMGGGASAQEAFAIMQPMFQQLWEELQKKPGSITDEGTLSLLQQAQDQGLVGDEMRTGFSAVVDVLEDIRGLLEGGQGDTVVMIDGAEVGRVAAGRVIEDLERGTNGRFAAAVREAAGG